MKSTYVNKDNLKIKYEESFWTGKKTIVINDVELQKVKKNVYKYQDEDYNLKGNYLIGASLNKGTTKIQLLKSLSWWNYILIFIPAILFTGGAVGSFSAALGMIINVGVNRKELHPVVKIILSLFTFGAVFVIYAILSILLLGMTQ